MRVLMLLVFALLQAGYASRSQTEPYCDESLINGAEDEYTYSMDGELKCKDDQDIILNNKRYASLTCSEQWGWRETGTTTHEKIAAGNEPIVIECLSREETTARFRSRACDRSLIYGFREATMNYAYNVLACKSSVRNIAQGIQIDKGFARYAKLVCFEKVGWFGERFDSRETRDYLNIAADETLSVNCTEIGCNEDLITDYSKDVSFTTSYQGGFTRLEMKCSSGRQLIIDSKFYEKLSCSTTGGWMEGEGKVKDATERFIVECAEKACNQALIWHPYQEPYPVYKDNRLRCSDHEKELRFGMDSDVYGSEFVCDVETGWRVAGSEKVFYDAADKFQAECVDKTCDVNLIKLTEKVEVRVQKDLDAHTDVAIYLTCKRPEESLFVSGSFHDYLLCRKGFAWNNGDYEMGNILGATCHRKACHPSLLQFNETDIKRSEGQEGHLTLACRNSQSMDLRTWVVQEEGGDYVYGDSLTCSPEKGWEVIASTGIMLIQRADVNMFVECVKKSCDKSLIETKSELLFDNATSIITCANSSTLLQYNYTLLDEIRCVKDDFWTYDYGKPLEYANKPISVECKAKACNPYLISNDENVVLNEERISLKCGRKDLELNVIGTSSYHNELACEPGEGWLDEKGRKIKDSTDRITVECIPKHCDIDLVYYDAHKVDVQPGNSRFLNTHAFCKNKNEQLFANNRFWKSLECDKDLGWREGTLPIGIPPRQKLNIDCREQSCDASHLIKNGSDITFTYDQESFSELSTASNSDNGSQALIDYNVKYLRCTESNRQLRLNGAYQPDNVAECLIAENQWPSIGAPADAPVTVECVETCKFSLAVEPASRKVFDTAARLTCDASKEFPQVIVHDDRRYTSLNCSKKDGWVSEKGKRIQPADELLEIACERFCLFNHEAFYLNRTMNRDRVEISCNNGSEALRIDNRRDLRNYPQLTCSYRGGWRTEGSDEPVITDTKRSLRFTCVPACTFDSNSYLVKEADMETGKIKLRCKDGNVMLVNGSPSRPLTCSGRDGWRDPVDPTIHYDSTMQLRTACASQETHRLCLGHFSKGVAGSRGSGPAMYSCKNTSIGSDKNGIKLNDAFVHSNLTCDIIHGWRDVEGKQLARAEESVGINCENIRCTTGSAGSEDDCKWSLNRVRNASRSSSYQCVAHNFNADGDPNRRLCGPKQKLLTADGLIVDSGLRCTDDGSWTGRIGKERVTVANGTAAFCIRRKCNSCSMPSEIVQLTSLQYTEGGEDSCAKASCASGLWSVLIDGQRSKISNEYYVGEEVFCSSKTLYKWELDDGRLADSVECATEVNNCDPFKLNVACATGWANCTELIALDHTAASSCPEGTQLFYKQPASDHFKGFYSDFRLSLHCDRTRGWIVKWKAEEIERIGKGGRVICANANPQPRTTTTTSTVEPELSACDLCPKPVVQLLDCPNCSNKPVTIDVQVSPGSDKCYANSNTGSGAMQSEKLGVIEGRIECTKEERVWKHNGAAIGKFAAALQKHSGGEAKPQTSSHTTTIVSLSLVGATLLIIVLVVGYKLWTKKRHQKPATSDDSKSNSSDGKDGKKGKEEPSLATAPSVLPSKSS